MNKLNYPKDFQVGGGWIPAGHTRTIASVSDIKSLSDQEQKQLFSDFERFKKDYNCRFPLIFKLVRYSK